MRNFAVKPGRKSKSRFWHRAGVAFALLVFLQPVFGSFGQILAKPGPESEGLFEFIEICTPTGLRIIRIDSLAQESGGEDSPDWSSPFCPGCLAVSSIAILDSEIFFLISYEFETVVPSPSVESQPASRLPSSDINARAPPFLA
ncbi:MAG: hypothetical protein AAF495_17765 [Pseudomonadota bacterium]